MEDVTLQDHADAHGRSTLSSQTEGRLKNSLLRRSIWNTRKMKKKDMGIEKVRPKTMGI